jgi:CheY-like chemotaxis protein
VTLRVSYLRETATFEIRDTGIGIEAAQLERLFQPFERGDPLRQDNGVGLGLTITRMLTALMGGELSVRSTPQQGTCFQVRLFLSEVRVPQLVSHAEHDICGYAGERRSLLVVDDQAEHRQVMAGLLEPLGFRVLQAASGQDGVRLAALERPDLILMDLSMPLLDGHQTAALIRRNAGSRAPIIVVSANAFADDRERSVSADCDDYLAKPVHLPLLLEKIGQQLGLTWLRRAPESPAPQPPRVRPSAASLAELRELGAQGYVRGILERLDRLDAEEPASQAFSEMLRQLVRRFALNEFNRRLEELEHD